MSPLQAVAENRITVKSRKGITNIFLQYQGVKWGAVKQSTIGFEPTPEGVVQHLQSATKPLAPLQVASEFGKKWQSGK